MSTSLSSLSRQERIVSKAQLTTDVSTISTHSTRVFQSTKSLYQVAQQLKFLHLQAEVESLLLRLQFLKQQRIAAATGDAIDNRH
jgi:hypothetical protein